MTLMNDSRRKFAAPLLKPLNTVIGIALFGIVIAEGLFDFELPGLWILWLVYSGTLSLQIIGNKRRGRSNEGGS